MADPTPYERTYSFTDFQANNPSKPLPGIQVDNELENIEQSLGGAIGAIKDVRRSDGKLKNGIVTVDSLSPQVAAGVGAGALASAAAAAASAAAAAYSAAVAEGAATGALPDGAVTRPKLSGELERTINVSPLLYGAVGDGTTDDSASYTAAEATIAQVFLPAASTFNLEAALPTKPVTGPGALKIAGVTFSGFEPTVDVYHSAMRFTPTSYLDKIGQAVGVDASLVISIGAGPNDWNRSTVVGTQNIYDPADIDRVEAFGNQALAQIKRGERITAVGSTALQYFGVYDPIAAGHNYWTAQPGFAPGQPGWNVAGVETLYPGIGAQIAAFNGFVTPTGDRTVASRTVAFGRDAFNLLTVGANNAAMGYRAGSTMFAGSGNSFFGADSNSLGVFVDDQSAFGFEAAQSWVTGARNTIIGRGAARNTVQGVNNVVVGAYGAGDKVKMNNSVVIGTRAGNTFETSTGALENALVIANENVSVRPVFLGGNFGTGSLAINPPLVGGGQRPLQSLRHCREPDRRLQYGRSSPWSNARLYERSRGRGDALCVCGQYPFMDGGHGRKHPHGVPQQRPCGAGPGRVHRIDRLCDRLQHVIRRDLERRQGRDAARRRDGSPFAYHLPRFRVEREQPVPRRTRSWRFRTGTF